MSSSDLEQVNEEKPSTSLAGLLATAELPNLKEVFYDEDIGVCAVHILGDKFILHSEIFGRRDREKLAQIQEVNAAIDNGFRSRGITEIYTWAETDEQYRYNIFLGFTPTGNEVVLPGYDKTVYEFKKEL